MLSASLAAEQIDEVKNRNSVYMALVIGSVLFTLSLGSGFCKGEVWVFSQTKVGSFFGVRAGVIE